MEAIKNVRFEEQFSSHIFDELTEEFKQPSMFDQLDQDLFIFNGRPSKQNQPQTGFISLLYGLMYDVGYPKIPRDHKKALDFFTYGVHQHLDPLCAYRLVLIYTTPQQAEDYGVEAEKSTIYLYLMLSNMYDIVYGVRGIETRRFIQTVVKEIDENLELTPNIIEETIEKIPYDCPLKSLRDMIVANIGFRVDNVLTPKPHQYFLSYRDHMNTLLQYLDKFIENPLLEEIIIERIIYTFISMIKTDDKMPEQIVLALLGKDKLVTPFTRICEKIVYNLQFLQEKDNSIQQHQREFSFEVVFLLKNILQVRLNSSKNEMSQSMIRSYAQETKNAWLSLQKVFKIYFENLDKLTKLLHKAVVIRQYASIVSKGVPGIQGLQGDPDLGIDIQKKELEIKKADENLFAIPHYKLGKNFKRLNQNDQAHQHLKLAESLFGKRLGKDLDHYQVMLCSFYMSRICAYFGRRDDELKYLQDANKCFQQVDAFKQVRTFQYVTFQQKVSDRIRQLSSSQQPEQISYIQTPRKDEQELLVESSKRDKQHFLGEIIYENYPLDYLNPRREDVDGPQLLNPQVRQRQMSMKRSLGASGFSFMAQSMVYQGEIDSIQIQNRQFFSKGHTGIISYLCYYKGQIQHLKTYHFLSENRANELTKHYEKWRRPSQSGFLKMVKGTLSEQVSQSFVNFSVLTEFHDFNLHSYMIKQVPVISLRSAIAMNILMALKNLHAQNIYVGHLKPTNILVKLVEAIDGSLKFVGFISDWETSMSLNVIPNKVCNYSAPEVFKLGKAPDAASDVWSLGVIFFLIFFYIDLGCVQHPRGLLGKSQVPFYINLNLHSGEPIPFDRFKVPVPHDVSDKSKELVSIIQAMTSKTRPSLDMVEQRLTNLFG